jgi:hypothetical protein
VTWWPYRPEGGWLPERVRRLFGGGVREQPCLMEEFFRRQQELPPGMRSAGALLVCNCPRCTRQRGTL